MFFKEYQSIHDKNENKNNLFIFNNKMTECLICASKFTPDLRREIKCQNCGFGVCLRCLKDDY